MATFFSCAAIGVFLAAAASDVARRTIPNELVTLLAILGLGRVVCGVVAGDGMADAGRDLAATLAIFALGAAAFAGGMLGGGDAKLLAAGALWVGAAGVGGYLLGIALAGGVLALGFIVWQFTRRGATRAGLPYALAIAAGGILATAAPMLA